MLPSPFPGRHGCLQTLWSPLLTHGWCRALAVSFLQLLHCLCSGDFSIHTEGPVSPRPRCSARTFRGRPRWPQGRGGLCTRGSVFSPTQSAGLERLPPSARPSSAQATTVCPVARARSREVVLHIPRPTSKSSPVRHGGFTSSMHPKCGRFAPPPPARHGRSRVTPPPPCPAITGPSVPSIASERCLLPSLRGRPLHVQESAINSTSLSRVCQAPRDSIAPSPK